ncbi:MAG: hypothetical protein HRF47_09620 [Chloroflexota bacterium]|jgi:hypothetical protein
MKHQPFEEWLLNDTPLSHAQKRELDLHVRSCAYCSALLETERVLHSVKMAAPAEGFTARFQARLAERRLAERRRRIVGGVLFLIGGLIVLLWLAAPSLFAVLASPQAWIASLVRWGIFLVTTLQAMLQAGAVMLRVVADLMPPFAWLVLFSAFSGVSLIWSISIWRFTRVPQGV